MNRVVESSVRVFKSQRTIVSGSLTQDTGGNSGKRLSARDTLQSMLAKVKELHGRVEKVGRPSASVAPEALWRWKQRSSLVFEQSN